MSILVKNMWMPDDCFDCPMCHQTIFKNSYKSLCYVLDKMCPDDEERLAECPLIDVGDDETIRINLNESERKKGKWIKDDFTGIIKCDQCGNDAPMDTTGGGQYKSNFCPNCGADMRGDQDE